MGLGTLQETITVTGDSPMIEVSSPSNVLNIDADFQKPLPLVEGKYWSDFLMMAPGVDVAAAQRRERSAELLRQRRRAPRRRALTGRDDGEQLQRLEHQPHGAQLGSDRGHEIKTGGVDAASPMGYGLVINMISKSGGNQFRGSGAGPISSRSTGTRQQWR